MESPAARIKVAIQKSGRLTDRSLELLAEGLRRAKAADRPVPSRHPKPRS